MQKSCFGSVCYLSGNIERLSIPRIEVWRLLCGFCVNSTFSLINGSTPGFLFLRMRMMVVMPSHSARRSPCGRRCTRSFTDTISFSPCCTSEVDILNPLCTHPDQGLHRWRHFTQPEVGRMAGRCCFAGPSHFLEG